MTDEPDLGDATTPAVGLREGEERRNGDRRQRDRGSRDRRSRKDRRRRRLRNLALTAFTLAVPHHLRHHGSGAPKASVSVAVNSFEPIPAARAYDDLIAEAAEKYDLDPILIRAVMRTESAFNPMAVSRAGAMGLMQLMPAVAVALGVDNPFDPRQNVMGGAQLLRELLDRYRGNVTLALAGYNAGPTAIKRGRIPPYKETRNYVKKITGLIAEARTAADND